MLIFFEEFNYRLWTSSKELSDVYEALPDSWRLLQYDDILVTDLKLFFQLWRKAEEESFQNMSVKILLRIFLVLCP